MTLIVPGDYDFNRVEPVVLSNSYSFGGGRGLWTVDMHTGGGGRYWQVTSGFAANYEEAVDARVVAQTRIRQMIDAYESTPEFQQALKIINHNPIPGARRTH